MTTMVVGTMYGKHKVRMNELILRDFVSCYLVSSKNEQQQWGKMDSHIGTCKESIVNKEGA